MSGGVSSTRYSRSGKGRSYRDDSSRIVHTGARFVTCCASAGEIGHQRESGGVAAALAAIDLQVFEHPLDIGTGLVEGDHLDPVDHADIAAARVAELMQPLPNPAGPGVVSSDRERIGAAEIVNQRFEVRAP